MRLAFPQLPDAGVLTAGISNIQAQSEKTAPRRRVILYEPDGSVRDALALLLESENWKPVIIASCDDMRDALDQGGAVAFISESKLPDCSPEDILEVCCAHDLPVIFTGHDLPLQGAVDLIRQGAADYLDKPFPQSRLLNLLSRLQQGHNA